MTAMRVHLETERGEFVVTGLLPFFQELPRVVIWGDRVFRLLEDVVKVLPQKPRKRLVYRECFAVACFSEEEWAKLYGSVPEMEDDLDTSGR